MSPIFWKVIFVILVLTLWTSPSSHSETYYVDQKHSNASDTNSGKEENKPWLTISRAAEAVGPGDTVLVKEGVYREQITVKKSGTDYNNMITFAAYPGDEVIVKGSDIVTDWEEDQGNVWKKENWEINSQQVFCDGKILQQIAAKLNEEIFSEKRLPRIGKGRKDMKPGSFYYDDKTKTLYIWLENDLNPNEHLIEVSVRTFFVFIGKAKFS